MNYDGMTDFEINLRVAEILGYDTTGVQHFGNAGLSLVRTTEGFVDYCGNWKEAGPLILSEKLWLRELYGTWQVRGFPKQPHSHNQVEWSDANPLRAVAIVFLMMQEGKDE